MASDIRSQLPNPVERDGLVTRSFAILAQERLHSLKGASSQTLGWLTSGNYPYYARLLVELAAHTPSETQVLHVRTVTRPCSEVYMVHSGVTRGPSRRTRTLSITVAHILILRVIHKSGSASADAFHSSPSRDGHRGPLKGFLWQGSRLR